MCQAVRDYGNEREIMGKIEVVKNLLEMNMPLETALKAAEIDIETFNKYKDRT